MKAIIYCRQSSGDETLSESVELQEIYLSAEHYSESPELVEKN